MAFEPGQSRVSKSTSRVRWKAGRSWVGTRAGEAWLSLQRPSLAPHSARFLSCQRSPAAAILELFEEQNGSLKELHYLMTLMERLDCASAIQNYLGGTQGGSPAPVRGGAWENQGLELDEKL